MGMSNMAVQSPINQSPQGKGFAAAPQQPQPLQSPQDAPKDVTQLYQQVLGREPELEGFKYWSQRFGDTIEANEIDEFKRGAQPELQQRSMSATSGQPRMGTPNMYANTVPRWDNASIMQQPNSANSMGKGGKTQSGYPTMRTNYSAAPRGKGA